MQAHPLTLAYTLNSTETRPDRILSPVSHLPPFFGTVSVAVDKMTSPCWMIELSTTTSAIFCVTAFDGPASAAGGDGGDDWLGVRWNREWILDGRGGSDNGGEG